MAPWELLPHLFLLLGLVVHHVTKPHNSLQSVPPNVSVDAWVGDAIVEAFDDVFLRDIRNGSTDIKEIACIGPEELVTFLFTLSKIVTSTCSSDFPLEVVDEDLLEPLPGVDRIVAEALQPRKRRRVQSYRKVDDLGDVGAPCDFNGGGVATQPLLRSLLAIILGYPDRLEALRVLVTAELCGKSWKTSAAVSTLCLDYFALSAPGINYGSYIASFIDSLAQVFWRRPMIGLS
jgi:hypothetical protein